MAAAAETFLRILHEEVDSLGQVLQENRGFEAVAEAAHRVRSHAAVGGAARVAQAAAKLELDARSGRREGMRADFQHIQRTAAEVELLLSAEA
jgi:HPt (histidine-containing phosphotransfer) domain-containing protein